MLVADLKTRLELNSILIITSARTKLECVR